MKVTLHQLREHVTRSGVKDGTSSRSISVNMDSQQRGDGEREKKGGDR